MTDWDEAERRAVAPIDRELEKLRERHRGDPPIDWLRAAAADALPPEAQDKIAAHLDAVPWSRALVDGADEAEAAFDARDADRVLKRIQAMTRHRDHRRPSPIWIPALAFGSLAIVLVVAVLVWRRPTASPAAPTAAATPSAAPARTPFVLELTKPDVKLTATALLVRGASGGRFVDDVAPGLNAYRAGDYAAAVRELEAVRPTYPQAAEIPFYVGVSRLLLNDAPGAVGALESARAVNEPAFADDISWYLAIAYERAGRRAESSGLLDGVCASSSVYAARACRAAAALR